MVLSDYNELLIADNKYLCTKVNPKNLMSYNLTDFSTHACSDVHLRNKINQHTQTQ